VDFEFEVGRDDIAALHEWQRVRVVTRHPEVRQFLVVLLWIALWLYARHEAATRPSLRGFATFDFALALLLVFSMTVLYLRTGSRQRAFERRAETAGTRVRMRVTDRGIQYSDTRQRPRWRWRYVMATGATADRLFVDFMFGRKFVIPRRAIVSPVEWDWLTTELRRRGGPAHTR
jgi:hypothetical protein